MLSLARRANIPPQKGPAKGVVMVRLTKVGATHPDIKGADKVRLPLPPAPPKKVLRRIPVRLTKTFKASVKPLPLTPKPEKQPF